MSVRTYNPSVRVGNWNEDIQLEEDTLKDFLERRERGELQIQKSSNLSALMTQKTNLSVSRDGFVHFGDIVMVKCLGATDRVKVSWGVEPRDDCTLAVNMSARKMHESSKLEGASGVSGSMLKDPCARNAFVITSIDGAPDGYPLKFGQPFYLRTASGDGLYMYSDRVTFQKSARRSRHQEVSLVGEPSFLTQWQILYFDPRLRMEYEGIPVPANEKIVVNHVRTNQNLAVEQDFSMKTPFGREYEMSAHTYVDSHRAEMEVNHWLIMLGVPGDEICPVQPQTSGNDNSS